MFKDYFITRRAYHTSQVADNANDPLVWHGGMKARWALAVLDAMENVKAEIPSVEWPFLILHGDADKITQVEGSIMFHEKASSKDKTIKVKYLTGEEQWERGEGWNSSVMLYGKVISNDKTVKVNS